MGALDDDAAVAGLALGVYGDIQAGGVLLQAQINAAAGGDLAGLVDGLGGGALQGFQFVLGLADDHGQGAGEDNAALGGAGDADAHAVLQHVLVHIYYHRIYLAVQQFFRAGDSISYGAGLGAAQGGNNLILQNRDQF